MKKEKSSSESCYVSSEKVQAFLAEFSNQIVQGRKRVHVRKVKDGLGFVVGNDLVCIRVADIQKGGATW